jgi:hypothetical protein
MEDGGVDIVDGAATGEDEVGDEAVADNGEEVVATATTAGASDGHNGADAEVAGGADAEVADEAVDEVTGENEVGDEAVAGNGEEVVATATTADASDGADAEVADNEAGELFVVSDIEKGCNIGDVVTVELDGREDVPVTLPGWWVEGTDIAIRVVNGTVVAVYPDNEDSAVESGGPDDSEEEGGAEAPEVTQAREALSAASEAVSVADKDLKAEMQKGEEEKASREEALARAKRELKKLHNEMQKMDTLWDSRIEKKRSAKRAKEEELREKQRKFDFCCAEQVAVCCGRR